MAERYRIRMLSVLTPTYNVYEVVDDTRDMAICHCYHNEEAQLIVKAMNKLYDKE